LHRQHELEYWPQQQSENKQASLIPTITQDSFEKGIVFSAGAFVSSIVAVRIGIWLYHRSDNPRELIPGRKDDGNA
jgi:hypothetical protein